MQRRAFLRSGAVALYGAGSTPLWLGRAVTAPATRRKVVVAIFQRGAADALNLVVPHGEPAYYRARPTIAVRRDQVIDLDGRFGLHPALSPLMPAYQAGQLAVVHATGSPDPTRSHFDAQDYMESGTPGCKSTPDGWLNRGLSGSGSGSPVRAVSMGATLARTLRGRQPAVAIRDVDQFRWQDPMAARQLEADYGQTADRSWGQTARETFEAVRMLEAVRREAAPPRPDVRYPAGRFAQSLREIAVLIQSPAGLEAAFADLGGWDHHVNEVGATVEQGPLANLAREFAQSLAAFAQDLGDHLADVVIVTMSEFGRTARENGNRGTDHGHGGAMFVLGGGVKGGKVHGAWPGLAPEQLYEGRDLAVTTDYRAVLAEVLRAQAWRPASEVFPGFSTTGDSAEPRLALF